MSLKIVLISIGSVIVVAGATAGALYLYSNSQKKPADVVVEKPAPTTGELNKDPCTLLDISTLQTVFGSQARDFKPGIPSEKTAMNGEAAEDCAYAFTTDKSTSNTLSMQTYLYKPGEGEVPGLDWNNIDKATLPTYFKEMDAADGKTHQYVMRSINGPTNYLYIISQPKDMTTFDKMAAITVLRDISNKAKYQ